MLFRGPGGRRACASFDVLSLETSRAGTHALISWWVGFRVVKADVRAESGIMMFFVMCEVSSRELGVDEFLYHFWRRDC